MSDYTPTTEEVREAASPNGAVAIEPDAFDRWLAAHDHETAARAWCRVDRKPRRGRP